MNGRDAPAPVGRWRCVNDRAGFGRDGKFPCMYRRGRHVGSPPRRFRTSLITGASNRRNLGPSDRVPAAKVGAQTLRERPSSPKGNFEGPGNTDRVAAGRWRRTGLRKVRPPFRIGQRGVVTMEFQASLQHFSSELSHIERDSVERIASGGIRVDIASCQERVAVKCLTCGHRIWVKSKKPPGLMTLAWRKSDRGALMGYLITAGVPKAKQCKQVVCLSCVENLLGVVTESTDRLSVTLSGRKDGGQDTSILRRRRGGGPWSQSLELTDDVLSFLCWQNATTGLGQSQWPRRRLKLASGAWQKGYGRG
jgi:DNA-directed RNA polymerase subunit RPC12/RpoP